MSEIIKIRDELYIKKGWDGYRVVYPIKKDTSKPYTIDKKWDNVHWRNLLYGGHWSRPIKVLLFLLALYLFVQAYKSDTATCREFVENIGEVCAKYDFNLDKINGTLPESSFYNLSFIQNGDTRIPP